MTRFSRLIVVCLILPMFLFSTACLETLDSMSIPKESSFSEQFHVVSATTTVKNARACERSNNPKHCAPIEPAPVPVAPSDEADVGYYDGDPTEEDQDVGYAPDAPGAETPDEKAGVEVEPYVEETPDVSDPVPPDPINDPLAFINASDTRALWLWDESPSTRQLLENSGGAKDELFSFAVAPHGQTSRALNRIFFEAREYRKDDPHGPLFTVTYDPLLNDTHRPRLRAFLKRAHAVGIAVEHLDGQAIWLASDANAQAGIQVCEDVLTFNRSTSDERERFAGIHLDVEPHTVTSGPYAWVWWSNRLPNGYNTEWTARWKHIMNECRTLVDAYIGDTGHKIVLSSDLGTDYAYYNKPIRDFFNKADGPLDYITIMNYFDDRRNTEGDLAFFHGVNEDGVMVGGVEQNLALWNKPLLIGVETGPTSIAPDRQS
ncbi:MAG: hypothetical protein ACNA8W_01930, partial [Bradymonadaceae bacterium]